MLQAGAASRVGSIYGGGVFVFGSIFILPFLLLFGGAIGWLAGRHAAS